MKATGIVRRIDDLGRLVIPKEIRSRYEIKEGDPLEIYVDENGIVIRKYQPGCTMCGEQDKLITIGNNSMCHKCLSPFARQLAMRRG